MSEADTMRMFAARYSVEFGNFQFDPGSMEFAMWWNRVVEQVPETKWDMLFLKVRAVLRGDRRSGRPHLPDFEEAWRIVRRERNADKAPKVDCAICSGGGWFVVPAREMDDGKIVFQTGHGRLAWYAWPCRCQAGIAISGKNRFEHNTLEAAWDTLMEAINACELPDDGQVLSMEEFMSKRSPVAYRSVMSYMRQNVIDSIDPKDRGPGCVHKPTLGDEGLPAPTVSFAPVVQEEVRDFSEPKEPVIW